jgi:hypothetical protein
MIECGTVDGLKFDHHAGRLTVRGIEDVSLFDFRGTCEIEHNPRSARHHKSVAERLDQAATGVACVGGKTKADLRDIDDGPVRVGQQKSMDVDFLIEIKDKAGLFQIACEPNVGGDRKISRNRRANKFVSGRR